MKGPQILEANEVRKGNIVWYEGTTKFIHRLETEDINDLDKGVFLDIGVEIFAVSVSVPMLINMGFEVNFKSKYSTRLDYFSNTKFGFDFNEYGTTGFRYLGVSIECKYIHTLQNLFYFMSGGSEIFQSERYIS